MSSGRSETGQPLLQEAPLGVRVHELERAAVRRAGVIHATEPAQELGAGRVQVVVGVELQALDRGQCPSTSPASAIATARLSSTTGEPVSPASSP